MNDRPWKRLSPISGFIFLAKIGKGLLQAAPGLLPLIVIMRSGGRWSDYGIPIAIVAAIFFGIVLPITHWYFFRYKITAQQVLIRSGVVRRKRLSVDFDRIQGVKLSQNPIFRLFGVYNLEMETAGSAQEEVALPGVRHPVVELIRISVHASEKIKDSEAEINGTHRPALLKLGLGELAKIGFTSNALIFVVVIAAPIFSLPDEVAALFFQRFFETRIEAVFAFVFSLPLWLAVITVATIIALAFSVVVALSIIGSIIRYHGYTLSGQKDRLISTSGLLTRHEQSIPIQKIQLLRIDQNLRQRFLNCFTVFLRQASPKETSARKNFRIPYTQEHEVRTIANVAIPQCGPLERIPYNSIDKRYILRTLRNYCLLPIVAGTALMIDITGTPGLLGIFALIPAYFIVRQTHRRWGYAFCGQKGFVRAGFLSKSHSIFELRRAQRVTVSQTYYQRRKGLADVSFQLASNKVSIPYIPEAVARQLQDQVLHTVETDPLPWI